MLHIKMPSGGYRCPSCGAKLPYGSVRICPKCGFVDVRTFAGSKLNRTEDFNALVENDIDFDTEN